MIIGENFYSWNPIFFQPIDPNNGRYFGNVIGNVSLEDQLNDVCDAEYYSWNPNLFRIEKPDKSGYFGNVIGNIPTQEQLDEVRDAGLKQKELIEDLGISLSDTIVENSEKYRSIANININAMSSIIEMFGGVFVLGSSTLDSTPLG